MRTYLRDIIGVPDPIERRQAIQDEGLGVIADFAEFEKEDIETLCTSIRKPGGTIPNPNAGAANAPATIPNPGFSISAICEKRLIAAAYTAKIYDMIGRNIDHHTMNRERLKLFDAHRLLIKQHEDPEKLPQVSKTFGIVKAMDLVPGHLRERLGVRGVALSYVIREPSAPPALPAQAANSATAEGYDSIMDELIKFTPHTGGEYAEDNAKVFQILQDMVTGTSFESSIKTHQRARDGRAAYKALCQHNLGSSKWDKILEDAETYVMKREWNGRNHRFSLRAHIAKHREANNEMVRAQQHVQYELPNDHTRVGRLLKSITSKDAAIISAITHIHGNAAQRDDFESAAEFLLLMAPNQSAQSNNHRISAIKADKNKGNGEKRSKTGVELRYYTKREYKKLTKQEKKELAELRKAQGDNGNKTVDDESTISAMRQQIEQLQQRVSAINEQSESQDDADDTSAQRSPLRNPLNQRS